MVALSRKSPPGAKMRDESMMSRTNQFLTALTYLADAASHPGTGRPWLDK